MIIKKSLNKDLSRQKQLIDALPKPRVSKQLQVNLLIDIISNYKDRKKQ